MSGGASRRRPCRRAYQRAAVVLALSATTIVNAEEPVAASIVPTPFGECRTGIWTGTRNLDDESARLKATCLAQWRLPLSEHIRGNLSSRAGLADAPNRASDSVENTATPRTSNTTARLREGYVEFEQGAIRIRAGRQIIAWGRADRINPTDNLSPRDFTFLSQEDEEQRNGLDALTFDAKTSGAWSATGVYVPRFEPHAVPQGLSPRGIVYDARPVKPELALKLDRAGVDIDFSLSYYQGFDRFARYSLVAPAQPTGMPSTGLALQPSIRASFNRQQTVGADLAFNVGKYAVRAEVATSRYSEVDPSPAGNHKPARTVNRAVVGIDRTIFETANLNLQVFSIHRRGDMRALALPGLARLNNEYGRRESGATLRISDRFLNEQVRLELSAIYDFSQRSYLLRPRLAYSFTDAIRLSAGADFYHGQAQSLFGARIKNNLEYVELAWIF